MQAVTLCAKPDCSKPARQYRKYCSRACGDWGKSYTLRLRAALQRHTKQPASQVTVPVSFDGVAEYIARNGVTLCEPRYVAPVRAALPLAEETRRIAAIPRPARRDAEKAHHSFVRSLVGPS